MLRVGFNARCLASPHFRGWKRYSVCLMRELSQLGCQFVLLTDKALTPEHLEPLASSTYEVHWAPPMKYLAWEQLWLPSACLRYGVDLLHSPMNFGLPALAACPTVLTLHDAIDVAFGQVHHGSLSQRLHRVSHWLARRSASKIITVSEHARQDIERHFHVDAMRCVVIPEAADLGALGASSTEDEGLAQGVGGVGRYVLYAGGFEARKNVSCLVDGFLAGAASDVKLLLVGKGLPSELQASVKASKGRIIATGYVSDRVLGALYRRALCFVYPSLYEGFGLQLCEAMSQGCPVLAANATSLPEVLGTGGDLFDPHDAISLARIIERVCQDEGYVQALRERALQRAQSFSWSQTAARTLELYRSLR